MLGTVWDRHHVLSHFGHPLPVPIRQRLDEHWVIERSAGLASRVVEGTSQFAGPGRTVLADLYTAPRSAAELIASFTGEAPRVAEDHRITEEVPGGSRHAFWLTATVEGRERHELYGFTAHDGRILAVACMYDNPDDLAWAQHVWRSATLTPHTPRHQPSG
ncbi:hypothetical protein [Bailinhaonella thermotolerans]|uniref:Uncharacterized protein n=1 Tax=Bailinhaonella thermotolerans TaxID=1070861 RepID=A0A3A4BBU2_9ACTN|nr:hypothetical protein [Bailinhaonella thermotolerans]RJL35566.1 hypothetical protein D5H75_01870 [Bailinhaonella thermotolerans]